MKIIFTILTLVMIIQAAAIGEDLKSNQKLSELENQLYGHSFSANDIDKRLDRLEQLVFGQVQSGSIEERIARLSSAVPQRESTLPPPTPVKRESKNGRNGEVTPEVAAYMTYVERTLRKHWHPPRETKTKNVVTVFRIEKDGSVSDIHLDTSQGGPIDYRATDAAFDAIKRSAPFKPLTPSLLADQQDDHCDIQFTFEHTVPEYPSPSRFRPLSYNYGNYGDYSPGNGGSMSIVSPGVFGSYNVFSLPMP